MAILESVLGNNIFYNFWKQIQQHIFSQNRIFQLITFKPIEIYNEKIELEVDTAKIKLHIKSNLENLMQRRIKRTLNFFTFNQIANNKKFQYNFNVEIEAHIAYKELSKFFNFHFSKQKIPLDEVPAENNEKTKTVVHLDSNTSKNKYTITIGKFEFYNKGAQLVTNLSFEVDAKWKFIKQKANGNIIATAILDYQPENYLIQTKNLAYTLESKNLILNGINKYYQLQIIEQLNQLLQYTFEAELQKVKHDAQQQINSLQEQNKWISGKINTLILDQIFIKKEGIHAILLADGTIDLI